jgi:hypothetical protein
MSDYPTGNPCVYQRTQADFDHVAPQQENHPPASTGRLGNGIDDSAEVSSGQHVREAGEKAGEGAIGSGR